MGRRGAHSMSQPPDPSCAAGHRCGRLAQSCPVARRLTVRAVRNIALALLARVPAVRTKPTTELNYRCSR